MNDNYLLKVAVTPVQEFIAEARKTRDLWIGSYLLSFITFKALEPFINNKCKIIYPAYKESPFYKRIYSTEPVSSEELQVAPLPNHFLVIVPENDLDDLVKSSKNNLEGYWEGIVQGVKNNIKNQFSKINPDWDSLWDNQIKDHWQYMWVAIPVSEDDLNNNYLNRSKEIQRFLEERKQTRTFKQWTGSSAIKCIQCGHREVLGPHNLDENSAFWEEVHKHKQFKVKIRKNEKLCSICIIKRFLKSSDILAPLKEPGFESTEDIAVIPFKNVLEEKLYNDEKNILKMAVKGLMDHLGYIKDENINSIDQISGNLLYIDELSPEKLIKEYFPELKDTKIINKKKEELTSPSNNLKELLKKISEEHKAKPSKYYAVLFMDGDNIGKWLTGALPVGLNSFTIKEHRDLSNRLGKLGVKVMQEVLRSSSARTIYSGGDDILALSPLDDILNLASELRKKFSRGFDKDATTSAGIVIAHYSEPLKRVLGEGRIAVEKAKERMEKDAFWITLILSSGTFIEGGYKWYMPKDISAIDGILSKLSKWIKEEYLSTRFIYDVLDCLDVFYDENNKLRDDMFKPEIERLFLRHLDKEKSPEINDFINNLSIIASPSSYCKEKNACDNVRDLLRITNFIAKEHVRWE